MNHASNPSLTDPDDSVDGQRVDAARKYVEQLKAFAVHAAVFAVGMVAIVLVNLFTNLAAGIAGDWQAWWSAWAFLGWGVGVAVHGLVVRLNRPRPSSTTWEQRQVDKVLSQ